MFFIKMNGLENDYIFVKKAQNDLSAGAVRLLCDRKSGIGADGVVLVSDSLICDCKMQIYNRDGTEAEMCGNALRCLGRYLADTNPKKTFFSVETRAGVKEVEKKENEEFECNLGAPRAFDREAYRITIDDEMIDGYRVDMGNPHFVLFHPYNDELAEKISENTDYFPQRTNVEFVEMTANVPHVRVYERGCGETSACGTGAAAVFAVIGKKELSIILPGGALNCRKNEKGEILQRGKTAYNFTGSIEKNVTPERKL